MFKKLSKSSLKREEGQGLVEYALILVLVSVVVIVILSQMGPAVGNIFSGVVTALNGGGTGDLAAVNDTEEDNSGNFSGVVQAGDPSGGGRYWDECNFTVSATGTYMVSALTTDKSSQFWTTAGGSGPASGFVMESDKTTQPKSSGTLNAGQTYKAFPHTTTPSDFPISYQFTISGPGTVTGSC